jgi:hypothetical protein
MAHTPGPWFAVEEPDGDEDVGYYKDGSTYFTGEFFRLVDRDADSDAERFEYVNTANPDNARLIASAPEMLEALKFARSGPYSIMNTRHMNEVLDAAIAKAEGR